MRSQGHLSHALSELLHFHLPHLVAQIGDDALGTLVLGKALLAELKDAVRAHRHGE